MGNDHYDYYAYDEDEEERRVAPVVAAHSTLYLTSSSLSLHYSHQALKERQEETPAFFCFADFRYISLLPGYRKAL